MNKEQMGMSDITTDKIVYIDNKLTIRPELKKVWTNNQNADLWRVEEEFTLPNGWEINEKPYPDEYVVESGWYIWDNAAATQIIDDSEVERYFGEESDRDILMAIKAAESGTGIVAQLKNCLTGDVVDVYATTESPDSSYGLPAWVDKDGQSYVQIQFVAPMGFELLWCNEDFKTFALIIEDSIKA
jgi:hypothetical protein